MVRMGLTVGVTSSTTVGVDVGMIDSVGVLVGGADVVVTVAGSEVGFNDAVKRGNPQSAARVSMRNPLNTQIREIRG